MSPAAANTAPTCTVILLDLQVGSSRLGLCYLLSLVQHGHVLILRAFALALHAIRLLRRFILQLCQLLLCEIILWAVTGSTTPRGSQVRAEIMVQQLLPSFEGVNAQAGLAGPAACRSLAATLLVRPLQKPAALHGSTSCL